MILELSHPLHRNLNPRLSLRLHRSPNLCPLLLRHSHRNPFHQNRKLQFQNHSKISPLTLHFLPKNRPLTHRLIIPKIRPMTHRLLHLLSLRRLPALLARLRHLLGSLHHRFLRIHHPVPILPRLVPPSLTPSDPSHISTQRSHTCRSSSCRPECRMSFP